MTYIRSATYNKGTTIGTLSGGGAKCEDSLPVVFQEAPRGFFQEILGILDRGTQVWGVVTLIVGVMYVFAGVFKVLSDIFLSLSQPQRLLLPIIVILFLEIINHLVRFSLCGLLGGAVVHRIPEIVSKTLLGPRTIQLEDILLVGRSKNVMRISGIIGLVLYAHIIRMIRSFSRAVSK
eukprot:CAMPEP_0184481930 /NCGR_PEP_ID=MMETSP0113_2-20130426/3517_1 /TAXON_ID=91329 /ORGANISM="Norrisiella sphaerica, Strain BC52" /LENGTH=177 /DNA_ID=CAMNT_0026861381 /DNA_START=68 /DNA_END=601 /DNA_ORIENTATION=-